MGVLEFLVSGISLSVVIGTFIGLAITRPLRLYHKWKIIKVTHKNGDVDYTLKRNGFLAMPFLYFPDHITEEDDYLGSFYATELSESKAKEIFSERYERYEEECGRKIVKREVIKKI